MDSLGITLSGGLDSRCILAATASLNLPVHTFTWGQDGAVEMDIAREVALLYKPTRHAYPYNYADFPNLFYEFGHTVEGMLDLRDAHFLTHSQYCKNHVAGVLNGYAGDLILGGSYLRKDWIKSISKNALANRLFRWRNSIISQEQLHNFIVNLKHLPDSDLPIAQYIREIDKIDQPLTPDISDTFFLENRVRRSTAMGTVLMRRDVESFSPFFDYDFVDFIVTITPKYRINHGAYRSMIRSTFSDCAKVPWDRTMLSPLAPVPMMQAAKAYKKIQRIAKSKFGFVIRKRNTPIVDFDGLFRYELRDFVMDAISTPSSAIHEILKIESFRKGFYANLYSIDSSAIIGVALSLLSFASALDESRTLSVKPIDSGESWTRVF
jgi:asparagine synthase (glutamine-hydrolysing)